MITYTIDEYQAAADRFWSKTKPTMEDLSSFGLGLAGEAAEVAEIFCNTYSVNFTQLQKDMVKELGDVLWYLAGLSSIACRRLSDIVGYRDWVPCDSEQIREPYRTALKLCITTGNVADYIKKVNGHGHPFSNDKLGELLCGVADALEQAATAYELDLSVVASGNIEKLTKRYPEGFTEERSKNRTE